MTVQFRKRKIDSIATEACSVFDVNNDGFMDIVSGEYWYEGPDFVRKHKICTLPVTHETHDDFCDYPMDVDGDGYVDIITGGWFKKALQWRKNPGPAGGEWTTYDIDLCGNVETIRFLDIDGCGVPELFPNTPNGPQAFYKLVRDAAGTPQGRFTKHVIGAAPISGHGLGFADINGDGRLDILLRDGWLEQPDNPFDTPWTFHPEFSFGKHASIPILGCDVTGNGLCDLIVGQAHSYGLHWYEQGIDADGRRSWIQHEIDSTVSQYHDLQLVDLDLDGVPELISGKRYRAHNDGDPGAADPVGLYYFKIDGGRFEKHTIDFGQAGECSGAGIYFWTHDLTGNGYPDIVAPGKEGLFLFENLGKA
ncbi:MAG: repeat-containing protein [Paenibacillus sp.]|nr:repeat-containing protein [Paenibacillus sp.]